VVKTFQQPQLIPQHLTDSEVPNCERSVSLLRCTVISLLFRANIGLSCDPWQKMESLSLFHSDKSAVLADFEIRCIYFS
jgi:hypothetical protein